MLAKLFSHLTPRKLPYLFVASHGLRTHLSALRWAAGRLRRSAGPLTREQKHLVTEIYSHTRVLTTAINAMFILGRLEEKEYKVRPEVLSLCALLQELPHESAQHDVRWEVTCPDQAETFADRMILSAILSNLFILCIEATTEPRHVLVSVREEPGSLVARFSASWSMPFVTTDDSRTGGKTLGGTPGLVLSLATELAAAIGGSVFLEEVGVDEEDLVLDGTVERGNTTVGESIIALRLPVQKKTEYNS